MTAELSHPRPRVLLDSHESNTCAISRPPDAHLRPRRRRTPSSRTCSPNRRSRAASSTTRSSRPGRPSTATFPDWLDARIVGGLATRGIDRPYRHQAEAIEAVHAGEDVVIVTPTASGKSLCYALPVLQAIADDPASRALFLFPTKALGQDQVAEFGELSAAAGMSILDVDLRRRHAGPDPLGRPGRRPGRRDEPGHAPLGDPAPPHEVVPALRATEDHRHRRAAHVPRRLRRARRQRPAAAAPDLRPLRQPPGHRLLLGDDREPGRAGGDAHRTTRPTRRPERRPGRRAARRPRRPARPRAGERRPGVGGRPSPSAGPSRSCGRVARRSSSDGRGSRSSCC